MVVSLHYMGGLRLLWLRDQFPIGDLLTGVMAWGKDGNIGATAGIKEVEIWQKVAG